MQDERIGRERLMESAWFKGEKGKGAAEGRKNGRGKGMGRKGNGEDFTISSQNRVSDNPPPRQTFINNYWFCGVFWSTIPFLARHGHISAYLRPGTLYFGFRLHTLSEILIPPVLNNRRVPCSGRLQ